MKKILSKAPIFLNGRKIPGHIGGFYYRRPISDLTPEDLDILYRVCYTRSWHYKPILSDWVDLVIMRELEGISKKRIGPVARAAALKITGSVVPRK